MLKTFFDKICWEIKKLNPTFKKNLREHVDFDLINGTDTWSKIHSPHELQKHFSENYNYLYEPCEPWVLHLVLKTGLLQFSSRENFQDITFIDMGSGKGRALLLASHIDFETIIGVEIESELSEIAQKNIGIFLKKNSQTIKCQNIVSVNQDATIFTYPKTDIFLVFFNPFSYKVFQAVLQNLQLSLKDSPRQLVLAYINPIHKDEVLNNNQSWLKLVFTHERFCIFKN